MYLGVVGRFPQLLAQPPHVAPHHGRVVIFSRRPDPAHQVLPAQCLPGVNRKLAEQPVLRIGQRHRLSVHRHASRRVVDGQASQVE